MKKSTLDKIIEELRESYLLYHKSASVEAYMAIDRCIEIVKRHAKKQRKEKKKL